MTVARNLVVTVELKEVNRLEAVLERRVDDGLGVGGCKGRNHGILHSSSVNATEWAIS